VDECYYAEDYDVLPTPHPERKRLSIEKYQELIQQEKEKLDEASKFLASIT